LVDWRLLLVVFQVMVGVSLAYFVFAVVTWTAGHAVVAVCALCLGHGIMEEC